MLVSPESPLTAGGGIATYISHASRAHIEAGNEILIVTYTIDGSTDISPSAWAKNLHLTPGQLHVLRFTAEELNKDNAFGWEMKVARSVSRRVEELIHEWRPDIVEGTDHCFPLLPLMQRAKAGLLKDPPLFLTFYHGLQEDIWLAAGAVYGTEPQKLFAAEFNALRFADVVMAPSEWARRNLVAKGIEPGKVHLVREPFFAVRSTPEASPRRQNFVYFGRVSFAKGVDRVARFFNFVFQQDASAKLHLLGPVSPLPFRKDHPRDFVCQAAKAAEALSVSDQRFDRAMLPELLADCGTFLNFSRSETFSYTTAEAVFMGLHVICDRNSAAAELMPPDVQALMPLGWETDPASVGRSFAAVAEADIERIQTFMEQLLSPAVFGRRYHEVFEATRAQVAHERAMWATRPWSGAETAHASSYEDERPLVSFLIATHNDAKFLLESIESIYAQSCHDYEIIIYNDGSTDPESLAIYEEVRRFPKVTFLDGVNVGLIGARNMLIDSARGRYSVFLDADDQISPDFLEKSLGVFERNGNEIDAVIPWRQNFGTNNQLICDYLLGTCFHMCLNDFRMTALIKTRVLRQLAFPPDLFHGEGDDWDFWLRFSLAGFKAMPLPEPVFRYRISPGSMSHPWSQGQASLTAALLAQTLATSGQKQPMDGRNLAHFMRMTYFYRHFSEV